MVIDLWVVLWCMAQGETCKCVVCVYVCYILFNIWFIYIYIRNVDKYFEINKCFNYVVCFNYRYASIGCVLSGDRSVQYTIVIYIYGVNIYLELCMYNT